MALQLQEPQNHVAFLVDESSSMGQHHATLPKLIDSEIKFLAERSLSTNQETRISIYLFSSRSTARCILFDMDVIRAAESFTMVGKYRPNGMTALCDATVLSIEDLKLTNTKYGQHSFWLLGFTDGMENNSSPSNRAKMPGLVGSMPDDWTFSIFVPDQVAKKTAQDYGFPRDNIAIWDTNNVRGVETIGATVRKASESFFTMRSSGGRGTRSLFTLGTVSTDQIKQNLTVIAPNMYTILEVQPNSRLYFTDKVMSKEFAIANFGSFSKGSLFYELKMKNEKIQAAKSIVFFLEGKLYGGPSARKMLGLPDTEVLVSAEDYPGYRIFVQSNAPNRNLIKGQTVMYLHGYPVAKIHGY